MHAPTLVQNRFGTAILTSAGPIVRSALTGRNAVARMADDFRRLVVTKGGVDNEDLLVAGWTQAQINALGSRARTVALAASVRGA